LIVGGFIAVGDQIIRFKHPPDAFWAITRFLSSHPQYQNLPLFAVPRLQSEISAGTYACLMDGKQIQAVVMWREVDTRKYEACVIEGKPYIHDVSGNIDGAFVSAILAVDRKSLHTIFGYLKNTFRGKSLSFNRHRKGSRLTTIRIPDRSAGP
jgi:hypothetical protein